MKKLILITTLILFCLSIKAQKYVVYADSLSAQKKINEISKAMKPYWQIKGDHITNCYDVVKSNNKGDRWCVEILEGYEKFFTPFENTTAIDVTKDAEWKRPKKEIGEIKPIR